MAFSHHEECPKCGSRDNFARYHDGGGKCWGHDCDYVEGSGMGSKAAAPAKAHKDIAEDLKRFTALTKPIRGVIRPEVAKAFGYTQGHDYKGRACHLAGYFDWEGAQVAGKIRYPNKGVGYNDKAQDKAYFPWIGTRQKAGPFGHQLWGKSPRLVICEGELDAMAIAQATKMAWPVISMGMAASNAAVDEFKDPKVIEYLENYEEIILFYDNDKAGRSTVNAVADVISGFRKVKIAAPLPDPFKDATDALVAGDQKAINVSIWNATAYRPKSIVMMSDLEQDVWSSTEVMGWTYPWEELTTRVRGGKGGQLVVLAGGSGSGKTEYAAALAYHWHQNESLKVGILFMEDPSTSYTAERFLTQHLRKDVSAMVREGTTPPEGMEDAPILTHAEFRQAWDELGFSTGRDIPLVGHADFEDVEDVLRRVRSMIIGLGCQIVFVDNITTIVNNMSTSDERKAIAQLVEGLKSLAKKTGALVLCVSHLNRPQGERGFEDGVIPAPKHLFGSQAVMSASDVVLAISRNARDERHPDHSQLHALKNRPGRKCGPIMWLEYVHETGCLEPTAPPIDDVDPVEEAEDDIPSTTADDDPLPF